MEQHTPEKEDQLIIWIDLETTGINPQEEIIVEFAAIATTPDANIVSTYQGDSLVYCEIDENQLDPYVLNMHTESGLLADLNNPDVPKDTIQGIETQVNAWLDSLHFSKRPMLGGFSIHFDRAFMVEHMPTLEARFHYRNMDATSVSYFIQAAGFVVEKKTGAYTHRAADDIAESVRFYSEALAAIKGVDA